MCLDSLAKSQKVYSKDVPLAQARDIAGLRAVFGEVPPLPLRSPNSQFIPLRTWPQNHPHLTFSPAGAAPQSKAET